MKMYINVQDATQMTWSVSVFMIVVQCMRSRTLYGFYLFLYFENVMLSPLVLRFASTYVFLVRLALISFYLLRILPFGIRIAHPKRKWAQRMEKRDVILRIEKNAVYFLWWNVSVSSKIELTVARILCVFDAKR